MPVEIERIEELIQALREPSKPVLVDGWTGAGKTTLGRAMADEIGADFFDLDDYLRKGQDYFFRSLSLDRLQKDIDRAAGSSRIVVAGVCMRDVQQAVQIERAVHVYVKRIASWGWADEDELNPSFQKSFDQIAIPSELIREVRNYHTRHRPHLVADFIYNRIEVFNAE